MIIGIHSHCSRPDNDALLGHATQSGVASSRQNNINVLLADVQGHRLALYLPAITAILVVLLDGAVKYLPQDTQQLLAAQAVTTPAAKPAASDKDGPAQLTADTEDAEAESDEEEEEVQGLARLAGRQQDLAAGDVGASLSAAGAEQSEARKELQGTGIAAQNARKLADGGREVRSGALRLLASVWARFPAQQPDSPVFERFFSAVAPLMQRITPEVWLRTVFAPCSLRNLLLCQRTPSENMCSSQRVCSVSSMCCTHMPII